MQYSSDTKCNVAQLLREPVGAERAYHLEATVKIGEIEEAAFEGNLDLLRTDKGILVQAHLETLIPEICSRCLSPFSYPLNVEFQEEFYPTVEVNLGYQLPLPEDSSAFTIDENHVMDIAEVIRQYAVLALPLKPLCQVECAGLCPQCGKNLNEGPCKCPPPPIDDRWLALHSLEISK